MSDKVNELEYDTIKVIDNLGVEEAKYIEFDFASRLKIKSGDWKFQINVNDKNGTQLDTPYEFIVSTKSVEPPKIIIADYSIENSFGTNYIPKDEVVELTIRVQNVGAGLTEKLDLMLLENHTYSSVDFTGLMEIDKLEPGDFIDLDFKIKSSKDHFGVKFETIDYLDNKVTHQVDLALMKHFRSKINLVSQEIGAMNVNPYPLQADEVDIEANIPIGKRNVNNMAILLAINNYDDINFTETKFSGRDGKIFRLYMQNLFGMDDYQLYPSKSWQMEDGFSKSDIEKIFDPHQGIVRNRVISSSKYSNIDYVDINIFYSGLGYWLNEKPYLIFKTYLYPFPDTTLLFVNQKQDKMNVVILYDKETQKDKKLTKLYNFLPNSENKNVIWYKRYCPYLTKFLYVYETKPTFTHWKLSSEYVCLPTHDTTAFPSLLECTNAMSGKIRNKRVFVQNSSEPLYLLSTVSKHPFQVRSRKLPSTVDSFALILCLLLLYYSINFS